MKKINFIVEPKDILSDEMNSIKGGNEEDEITCNSDGKVKCHPTGNIGVPTEPTSPLNFNIM